jgi:flagellar basal-body rod protein FlgC
MSDLFSAFTISGSGLYTDRKWLDAISDNISNINTVKPFDQPAFQERFIQAQAANVNGSGGGVEVTGAQYGDSTGIMEYAPGNPNANAQGYIRTPDINLGEQMTNMIEAQRGYQANAQALSSAKSAYEAALSLGK